MKPTFTKNDKTVVSQILLLNLNGTQYLLPHAEPRSRHPFRLKIRTHPWSIYQLGKRNVPLQHLSCHPCHASIDVMSQKQKSILSIQKNYLEHANNTDLITNCTQYLLQHIEHRSISLFDSKYKQISKVSVSSENERTITASNMVILFERESTYISNRTHTSIESEIQSQFLRILKTHSYTNPHSLCYIQMQIGSISNLRIFI